MSVSLQKVAAACAALGVEEAEQLTVVQAAALCALHCPGFAVDHPAWVVGVMDVGQAQRLVTVLRAVYPAEHGCWWVGSEGAERQSLPLERLAEGWPGVGALLYLPPLPTGSALEAFQEVVAHLRAPDGCPWDRKQTHESLRPYLLEETYEALDALDAGDAAKMCEEFGDLLLQIVLHAQIAAERGSFNLAQVSRGIYEKIVRRHPHVFGEVQVDGVGDVLQNWERLKAEERAANGQAEKGMLDSVPLSLPALSLAGEYQSRAERVGLSLNWSKALESVRDAFSAVQPGQPEALGALLFAVTQLAHAGKMDAESALREQNRRFRERFQNLERFARKTGADLTEIAERWSETDPD